MFGLENFTTTKFMFMYEKYITLYENVMNYFLNTTCIPKWEKLKYLKYIRLSLQDHQ